MNWVNAMADKGGIDLLIGGSPCQGFSSAGRHGHFDDPRSKLFWQYVKILGKLKPKYFMLENVKMKQSSMDIISDALDVEPILINSDKVSAHNRQRYYWTNIPFTGRYYEPIDKGILLQDVIEDLATSIGTSRTASTLTTGRVATRHSILRSADAS